MLPHSYCEGQDKVEGYMKQIEKNTSLHLFLREKCGSRHSPTWFIFNAPQISNFPWLCKLSQVVKSSVIHSFNAYTVYLLLHASFEERVYRGSFGNAVCNAFQLEQGFNYPYMPRPKDCCFLSLHEKIKMSLNRFSLRPVSLLAVKTVRLLDKYISLQYYRLALLRKYVVQFLICSPLE